MRFSKMADCCNPNAEKVEKEDTEEKEACDCSC